MFSGDNGIKKREQEERKGKEQEKQEKWELKKKQQLYN